MTTRRRKCGFALLIALVLVALAGAAMANMARRSMSRALEAEAAVDEVQRRWAVASCRRALLGRVEFVLDGAAERRLTCQLAGTRYELVFTDEQAKVNVNRLLEDSGRGAAQRFVRQIADAGRRGGREAVNVALRPMRLRRGPDPTDQPILKVIGYGQVFDGAKAADLRGDELGTGLSARVTCWGNGKVNIHRAPAEVIALACDGALGRDITSQLLEARRRRPSDRLSGLLASMDALDDKAKVAVQERLTDESTCHGLWMTAHGRRRAWHALSIAIDGPAASQAEQRPIDREVHEQFDFSW